MTAGDTKLKIYRNPVTAAAAADAEISPALAIAAFAGLRLAEVARLDGAKSGFLSA